MFKSQLDQNFQVYSAGVGCQALSLQTPAEMF